jgi:hypothetical protein
MMQGKNGRPWPTAINPKFLAQTQIGTMIQSSQNMTIVDQLMNDKTKFQEIDMGKYDEDDKQYIYVDIENKKVYDVRNENHMLKLQDLSQNLVSAQNTSIIGGTQNTAALKDWWKKKRRNNQDLLFAAENGIIDEVKMLLDRDGPKGDLAADVNARGLDQWTALHFAANEGKSDIIQVLL